MSSLFAIILLNFDGQKINKLMINKIINSFES